MFVDKVKVKIQAGNGGNGAVSFRHEKFIAMGGPDGGDGGKGGDVVAVASTNQDTLANFRYQKLVKAESGQSGGKRKRRGKSGNDLVIPLPVGTQIIDEQGTVLADLTKDGQQVQIAKGGKGGFGNAHFVSSTRQAPRVAEKGEPGEQFSAEFELKMIADVGLIGLPNAGKSTLLARVSNAHPEIADYPFTTLNPNLGVVDIGSMSLLIADIPGLIEGASQGKGLGVEFLRHVERTSVLVHLIDVYEDTAKAYHIIQKELKDYKIDLTKRPQVVVLNKIDGVEQTVIDKKLRELKKVVPKNTKLFAISSQSGTDLQPFLFELAVVVKKERTSKSAISKKTLPILRLPETDDIWHVEKQGKVFVINGKKIERFASQTDFTSVEGVERLRDIMRKMGIEHELIRQGITPKDRVNIGWVSLDW